MWDRYRYTQVGLIQVCGADLFGEFFGVRLIEGMHGIWGNLSVDVANMTKEEMGESVGFVGVGFAVYSQISFVIASVS